jgi:RNA polymerase sigma factor (sigma-70 family)
MLPKRALACPGLPSASLLVLARAFNGEIVRRAGDGNRLSEERRLATEGLCELDEMDVLTFIGAERERQLGRGRPARQGRAPSARERGASMPRRRSSRYVQLVKACRRRGIPKEDAKEIVQEAHLRMFEYQKHTVVRDVDSLLRRIVINLSITFYHRELEEPRICESVEKADRQGELVEKRLGLDEALMAEQSLETMANLLGAISERTCQIFLMQRAGYNYKEIASAFVIKPRTVEKHVNAAMLEVVERQDHSCEYGSKCRSRRTRPLRSRRSPPSRLIGTSVPLLSVR